ncbi:hypothetical protein JQC91_04330 [Jannaschia sp. Os4]|uniref:cytochrome PufQ n=1 Tax=Jannaschia sp. Os4 TaxID=2807617 RepID=UPI00193A8F9D|nr:cytochrome PufQ [Jannaschia sp. Os4]MBM2575523.1 hypothetical protein [Jannaschia sp. Os4]
MADFTSNAPRMRRDVSHRSLEYRAYFVPIFALALPGALLRATVATITSDPSPRPGILDDARRRARDVTTMICSI